MTNTRVWKVERETETTQAYFYDPVGAAPRSAQVALYAKGLRSDDVPVVKSNLKISAKARELLTDEELA